MKTKSDATAPKAGPAAGAPNSYRVVYGEERPAWEKSFPTLRAAMAFARKHDGFGDVIFSITRVGAT